MLLPCLQVDLVHRESMAAMRQAVIYLLLSAVTVAATEGIMRVLAMDKPSVGFLNDD